MVKTRPSFHNKKVTNRIKTATARRAPLRVQNQDRHQEKAVRRDGIEFGQCCDDSEDELTQSIDILENDPSEEFEEGGVTSIRKTKFASLVYEVSEDFDSVDSPIIWTDKAIEAVQVYIEDYIADLFKSANCCAHHRNTDIVYPQDLQLASALTCVHICSNHRDMISEKRFKNDHADEIIDLDRFVIKDYSHGCR